MIIYCLHIYKCASSMNLLIYALYCISIHYGNSYHMLSLTLLVSLSLCMLDIYIG